MTGRDPRFQTIHAAGMEMTWFERACFIVVAVGLIVLVVASAAFLTL
jgi:hypothetical protein